MADLFLFSIAESLIEKLASSAYQQASRVIGVYDELQEFKETLRLIKAVLLDADQKREHNHELQEWLRRIKLVFSDAENVLDEFECERSRKQVLKAYGTAKTKVDHFFSTSNPLVFRYKMAKQIRKIRKRLDKIAADRHKFGLRTIDVDTRVVHMRELTYSTQRDSDVIGREHDKELIIQLLMQPNPCVGDQSLPVIPIVGMGGLGKTTLAKFVFNDKRIDESFSSKMWVCVSDDFDIKQLIIKIINSADSDALASQQNLKESDMQQLQNHLRNKLADEKFLLILDDVWNEDRVRWVELKNIIQVGAQDSKIIVTTRSHTIASMMGTIPSYILKGISQGDSFSLLKKWAFKKGEEEKYLDLLEVGREIVKKCGGVPLAIRTIGSLLFSKFDLNEWESVRDDDIWNLPQKKYDILPALKLSYDQMPSYLRQCFVLFSLYPKDYIFTSFDITQLWGTLGLLRSPNKNKTWLAIANRYLYELMSRSFLQNFIDFGYGYSFQIHDLVHDLAMYVARDECLILTSRNIQNRLENVQHLSFAENDLLDKSFTPNSIGVRTILFPIKGMGPSNAFLIKCMAVYKYLRVLDLSDCLSESLPRSIGKLRHLRFLNLENNRKIKRVPDSICELQNLQVLNLRGCTMLESLPKGLRNLINLKRLEITTKQTALPENDIAHLCSLEILHVESCDNLESLFLRIKLPTLKVLSVSDCENLKFLALDINHFPELEGFMVDQCGNLELSKEHDDPKSYLRLKAIGLMSLPQLMTLPYWLQESANTLQHMSIYRCGNFEVLPEWLSTLSFMKSIIIRDCPKLKSLPNDTPCLSSLGYLEIEDCPELCRKCQPLVGEYWPKICHIKQVVLKEKTRRYREESVEDEMKS